MSLSKRLVSWARQKSPWIILFNSGACNACDIEVLAALTPRFDVERLGILAKGTPRHADILIVTGPVTRKQGKRLRMIYDQMPEPKYVLAMGACGATGGVFKGLYHVLDGVDAVIPPDMYVAGCPPRPDEIIDGIVKILGLIEQDMAHGGKEWRAKRKAVPQPLEVAP
ncbi:MAG TPA: NADH-quinone oxidoreductase subunit B family protein [Thermoplasmata archaeon]|nr:NADH-quinone oxidoreductase subunit B family protein [Thermoplasmata archaeon]HLA46387.1 NADH-quinone oxidoreductase subunit B family protein [Thermoplasmata archaeon]